MKKFKKLSIVAVTALSLAGIGANAVAAMSNNVVFADDDTATLKAKLNKLNQETAQLNDKVSAKQLEIDKINAAIEKSKDEIADTKEDIAKAQKELDDRKDVLKKQLVDLQKKSNTSISGNVYLDYLLNSGSFSELIGRTMAVNKISGAQKAAIDDVNDAKEKLNNLVKEQQAKQDQIVDQKDQLAKEMTTLKSDKSKAEAAQKELQQEIWDNQKELEAQEKANTAATQALVSGTSTTVNANGNSFIANVAKYIGVPYVWGGSTPSGFDCSGLIQYAAAESGISLPRVSQAQSTVGTYVALADLQAGDLVFWGGVGSAYHVGIYIGNGQYIHAPAPGQNVTVGSVQWFTPSFGRRL